MAQDDKALVWGQKAAFILANWAFASFMVCFPLSQASLALGALPIAGEGSKMVVVVVTSCLSFVM